MRDDFDERRREVEQFFDFLNHIDDGTHRVISMTDGSAAYSSTEQTEILKTFKANGFLLLYNLIESTVKNAIEAIFDELQTKSIDFDSCRDEVRKVVLNNLRKWKVEKLLPNISLIGVDIVTSTFRKETLFSGNVDARAVRNTASGFGFRHPKKKSDELLTVKANRNDLAHGDKSFADVGRDYSVSQLLQIRTEVFEYLEELIDNVDVYISGQHYLGVVPTVP